MSKNILAEICARKAEHVEQQKQQRSLAELKAQIADIEAPRSFVNALQIKEGPALIAEVKKASPSKGLIREDFNPAQIAQSYEQGGASCISCLTDEPYFQGRDEYLQQVKEAVSLPVLRKDFMIDPYQIYEARALGADCILLIMAALDDDMLKELYEITATLNMDALFEVHDAQELERALVLNPKLLGVNARNLKTLDVDLQTPRDLAAQIPDTILKIAESGIGKPEIIKEFYNLSYKAFLVGESLMRQDDIEEATRALLS